MRGIGDEVGGRYEGVGEGAESLWGGGCEDRASGSWSGTGRRGGSGEDGVDDFAGDVGEAEAAAVVGVGELFVVEAEEVQDGGVEVVDVDLIDGGLVADLVGFAVADAAFDAAAGHPGGEGSAGCGRGRVWRLSGRWGGVRTRRTRRRGYRRAGRGVRGR